ncbi:MAG TPA: acetate--CoA ligase family protein [Spirochaetota bacterium]|nr:acetate--CoA ligase family protein [Spirochaetota bacterium]
MNNRARQTLDNTCRESLSAKSVIIAEHLMKDILRQYAIPVPAGRLCLTPADAVRFGRTARPPYAIKLVSDRVLHKTELGGVRLGIDGAARLKSEFTSMDSSLKKKKIQGYAGILVEEQCPPGVEIIVGLQHDEVFGPVMMIGLGGIYTDIFKDVSFRPLPVSRKDITAMIDDLKARPLLAGFRGSERIDMKALAGTIGAIGRFGADAAPWYESVDFNPVIARPDGCVVVDAKMVLRRGREGRSAAGGTIRTGHLDNFFRPKSVAVLGASATPGKIGNIILDSLASAPGGRTIFPVNPNAREILGMTCYPSLDALPAVPDLVIVIVDLAMLPDIIRAMAALGCHNAIVISGGGRELGGGRAELEEEIRSLAREHDVRIIGPNCIGCFDGASRFDSFFYPKERLERPPRGTVSFITQSGTWGCAFLEKACRTGIAKMVSYGNRADVDEGDLISFLADDPDTSVIGSYIEGLSDGKKFLAAVRESVARDKPVVVFKTGRNPVSARASVSHTGAYGGTYHVYRGALGAAGAVLTDSFDECYAACEALSLQPAASGNRAALVSNGAGPMVNAIDLFPDNGIELVKLSRSSVERMRSRFSFFYLVENPVDVTGSATASDYRLVMETLAGDGNVDIIMPFFVFQNSPLDESIVEVLADLSSGRGKPIVCCASGGPYTDLMRGRLNRAGVPLYDSVIEWVAAARGLVRWGAARKSRRNAQPWKN